MGQNHCFLGAAASKHKTQSKVGCGGKQFINMLQQLYFKI